MSSDYGVYQPPGAAAPDRPLPANPSSASSSPAPRRPLPPRRSGRDAPASMAPPSSDPRYEPLVTDESTYATESGCPSCGVASARSSAIFCDQCGHTLAAAAAEKTASVGGISGWEFKPSRYGPFGWIETVVKIMGIAMGLASLSAVGSNPVSSHRIAEGIFAILAFLVYGFLLVQRWFFRELFALIFGAVAVLSYIFVVVVIFNNNGTPGSFLVVFFFCMTIGQGIQMFYLCFQPPDFDISEHPLLDTKLKLWIVSISLLVLNLCGLIVQLLILTTTFQEQ